MELWLIITQLTLEDAQRRAALNQGLYLQSNINQLANTLFVNKFFWGLLWIGVLLGEIVLLFTIRPVSWISQTYFAFLLIISIAALYGMLKKMQGLYWAAWYLCPIFIVFSFFSSRSHYSVYDNFMFQTSQMGKFAIHDLVQIAFIWVYLFWIGILFLAGAYRQFDYVPFRHPLSRLIYFGWHNYIHCLHIYAQEHHWQFFDASPLSSIFAIQGEWRGHTVFIQCFQNKFAKKFKERSLYFNAIVTGKQKFWPFMIEAHTTGNWIFKTNPGIKFSFATPQNSATVNPGLIQQQMVPLLKNLPKLMQKNAQVFSTENLIIYQNRVLFSPLLSLKDLQFLVDWITRIAANLEMWGYVEPIQEQVEEPELEEINTTAAI